MKSRAASLLFTILLTVITINGQTPSIRTNGNSASDLRQSALVFPIRRVTYDFL